MVQQNVKTKACKNGSGSLVWGKPISVSDVVDLVAESCQAGRHPAVKINAKKLIGLMSVHKWQLKAGRHSGGTGGKGQSADSTPHVTIMMRGSGYHLRQDKRGHLFEITGPGMKVFNSHASPGTDIGGRYKGQ